MSTTLLFLAATFSAPGEEPGCVVPAVGVSPSEVCEHLSFLWLDDEGNPDPEARKRVLGVLLPVAERVWANRQTPGSCDETWVPESISTCDDHAVLFCVRELTFPF